MSKLDLKIAVYTAIVGDFDDIHEPVIISENIDYILFTNIKINKKTNWEVIFLDINVDNCRKKAREIKILGNERLKDYDYVVWVDGNIKINKDIVELINYYAKSGIDLATFKHFQRDCIYEEALMCARYRLDSIDSIYKQISDCIQNEYPLGNGLAETNVLIKNNKSKKVQNFMEIWWEKVRDNCIRDQLSFNYVLWKIPLSFQYMDGNSRGTSDYFSLQKHNSRKLLNRFYNYIMKIKGAS